MLDIFGDDRLHGTITATEYRGAFEVFIDGRLVYSKKQTGEMPADETIRELLRSKMGE